ncbi:hypothetical protein NKI78_04480 [Mesorhizobium sp. M0400]|uniref:hypothetical protein n=1 Tax=Mesorhizobium sp. M0400 TaxID=2956941 RepID=UPI00333C2E8E
MARNTAQHQGTIRRKGQATSAQSSPVTIASDQSDLPVKPGSTETKITAATMPTGGVGFVGWLSAIWHQLTQLVVSGGSYNTSLPVRTNGDTGVLQQGIQGALFTTLGGLGNTTVRGLSTSNNIINPASRSSASSATGFAVFPYKYNGASTDLDVKPNAASRIPSAAATTNATSAKGSTGDLHLVNGNNASGAIRYMKFYNKATAPTVGTDVPVLTLALPTGAFSFNLNGFYFSTGIAYALTTGAADADTGALTLADVLGLTVTYA